MGVRKEEGAGTPKLVIDRKRSVPSVAMEADPDKSTLSSFARPGGDDPNLRAAEILDHARFYVAAFKISPRAAILLAAVHLRPEGDGEHRGRDATDALRYWRARRQRVEEAFVDAIELAKRGFLD